LLKKQEAQLNSLYVDVDRSDARYQSWEEGARKDVSDALARLGNAPMARDELGDTVLHDASASVLIHFVAELLKSPTVRKDINLENEVGLTAIDTVNLGRKGAFKGCKSDDPDLNAAADFAFAIFRVAYSTHGEAYAQIDRMLRRAGSVYDPSRARRFWREICAPG